MGKSMNLIRDKESFYRIFNNTCIVCHSCLSLLISGNTPQFSHRFPKVSAKSFSAVCTQETSSSTCWALWLAFSVRDARFCLMLLSSALWWFWRLPTCWERLAWASAVELAVIESLSVTIRKTSFSMFVASCSKAWKVERVTDKHVMCSHTQKDNTCGWMLGNFPSPS